MDINETKWDKLLRIHTGGRDDTNADNFHFPYEPTPYCVLERLAQSGLLGKRNTLIDYGCGKGRVDFFLAYETKCRTIGVEYDERILSRALENRETAAAAGRTEFIHGTAEDYQVPAEADRFYFFNPFSVEILKSVMAKILESYYSEPREMLLFSYYPSDEFAAYLTSHDSLEFYDEIDCMDLFEGTDARETILIFRLV